MTLRRERERERKSCGLGEEGEKVYIKRKKK
jgi:hypothetical protein